MQHASFLYRQRAPRGLRATNQTPITRFAFFSAKVNLLIITKKKKKLLIKNYRLLGTPQNQQQRTLYFLVEAKSRVREVYTQTCLHFVKQGMLDTELFGLSVLIGNINFKCF